MDEDELIRFLKNNMRIHITPIQLDVGNGFKIGIYIDRPFQKELSESTKICESEILITDQNK